jgi:hypothetical protein
MRTSKAMIEDRLGTAASCFAYPYGRYTTSAAGRSRATCSPARSDALEP